MSVTYFQRSDASDLTGPTGTGGTTRDLVASRTAGSGSVALPTGNMNSNVFCNQNFFTPPGDPGIDGAAGDFTVVVRVDSQNANIGIRVFLSRVSSTGAVITTVESSQGSQTAGAASRTFTWTNPALGTWGSDHRLLVRVQLTNTSGSMNQSASIGVDTSDDTIDTPFTAAAPPTGGTMRRWTGSVFVPGGTLKRWTGSVFVAGGTLRRWTGSGWEPPP